MDAFNLDMKGHGRHAVKIRRLLPADRPGITDGNSGGLVQLLLKGAYRISMVVDWPR